MRSSIAQAVHAALGKAVHASRRRCHSPQRTARAHVATFACKVNVLGGTLKKNTLAAKRRMLKKWASTLAGHASVAVRDSGSVAVASGYSGYVWVGHALLLVTPRSWELLEVTGACTVTVTFTSGMGVPSLSRLAYNCPTASINATKIGTRVAVSVAHPTACLRVVTDLDDAIVQHWAPHKKLIYAQCDPEDTALNMIGAIHPDNSIHCVVCNFHCGSGSAATDRLSAHLNIHRAGLRFRTCNTPR